MNILYACNGSVLIEKDNELHLHWQEREENVQDGSINAPGAMSTF